MLRLENRNEVLNAIPRVLSDTLCNPRNTPDFMLFELQVAIKDCVLELLKERLFVEMNLLRDELVLELCREAITIRR